MPDKHEVTLLLQRWADGDQSALTELTPIVYRELRHLAASYLRRELQNCTLQPTALVHEVYLRLVEQTDVLLENRSHFFGIAARIMRQILVDQARRRRAAKRNGLNISIEEMGNFGQERSRDVVALNESLNALEKIDSRKSRAVELRYFAGMSLTEISQMLQVSEVTVRRDLRMAEAWLHQELTRG